MERLPPTEHDPVELLQSMPEGATLKVAVADSGNVRREATFGLGGLSGIRHKIGTACKWAPTDRENLIRKPLNGEQPRALNRAQP